MTDEIKTSEVGVRVEQDEAYRFTASFDGKPFPAITLDEPPPLGTDAGPNAARMLAVAIGNCLAASLVFCLGKRGVKADGVTAHVTMDIVRTTERRLRVGEVRVALQVPSDVPPEALAGCREVFEDFCTVTASVRRGIDVRIDVRHDPV
jgi:uncharacterized OsmC-like protein